MPPPRKRADVLLVERGLFESRARAQAAIEAGLVTANARQVLKASENIPADAELQAQPPDIVVIDVSFISLKAVLPMALSLAAAPMHLLALIKPQFEAARKHSRRGIIRNAMVHQQICDDIAAFAASLGCRDIQVFPSSIKGGDGNTEFFIGARRG